MPDDATADGDESILRIRDVRFGYQRRHPVLKGVDLEVRPGEIVGISGENGSGKSTLLKLIVGLLKSQDGTVERTGQSGYRWPSPPTCSSSTATPCTTCPATAGHRRPAGARLAHPRHGLRPRRRRHRALLRQGDVMLLVWVGSWIGLCFALRGRSLDFRRWFGASMVVLAVALLLVWPPVRELFESRGGRRTSGARLEAQRPRATPRWAARAPWHRPPQQ